MVENDPFLLGICQFLEGDLAFSFRDGKGDNSITRQSFIPVTYIDISRTKSLRPFEVKKSPITKSSKHLGEVDVWKP